RETCALANPLHLVEQRVLAEKAAVQIIANVLRILKFRSGDDAMRNVVFLRERHSLLQLCTSHRWRICGYRQHTVCERLSSRPRQVRRIDAAGVGYEHAAKFPESFHQC